MARIKIPNRYECGLIENLDKRSVIYRQLNAAFEHVCEELGGIKKVSYAKTCLIGHFVFLQFQLQQLEQQIAEHPKRAAALVPNWTQYLNDFASLAKIIGINGKKK